MFCLTVIGNKLFSLPGRGELVAQACFFPLCNIVEAEMAQQKREPVVRHGGREDRWCVWPPELLNLVWASFSYINAKCHRIFWFFFHYLTDLCRNLLKLSKTWFFAEIFTYPQIKFLNFISKLINRWWMKMKNIYDEKNTVLKNTLCRQKNLPLQPWGCYDWCLSSKPARTKPWALPGDEKNYHTRQKNKTKMTVKGQERNKQKQLTQPGGL